MSASTETPRSSRTFGTKARTLAFGALATAALALPAISALSVAGHDASKSPAKSPTVGQSSHRLALGFAPNSLRLT